MQVKEANILLGEWITPRNWDHEMAIRKSICNPNYPRYREWIKMADLYLQAFLQLAPVQISMLMSSEPQYPSLT